jgi:hypothetical protein
VTQLRPRKRDLEARIQSALSAALNAEYDGAHHKNWVIDQMVRELFGCPTVMKSIVDAEGKRHSYPVLGENAEYKAFVARHHWWDEGTSP